MDERIKKTIKYLLIIWALSFIAAALTSNINDFAIGNVAHITISGVIVPEKTLFGSSATTSTSIIKQIEDAQKNNQIKALLIEINSPGGSAVASAEIADAIKRVNKTTVAWIRDSGASGAYWDASATDYIVAHPLSITGSIGVLGSYIEIAGLLERYNASYQRLVSGKYKDMGSPLKKLDDDEREKLQGKLDIIHEYFIEDVAKNRNMSVDDVRRLATGEFYLGEEALKLKLVDELGGKKEAEAAIKRLANITSVELVSYKKKSSLTDIFGAVIDRTGFSVGRGISYQTYPSYSMNSRSLEVIT